MEQTSARPIPRRATLALIAAVIGISASAVLNKLALGAGLHPIWLNVLRLAIAVLCMLPFALRDGSTLAAIRAMDKKARGLSLLSGAMLGVHFAAWAGSLALADSLVAVAIWSTFSLMTVVGSALLLRERTPLPALLGMLVAIVGVGICAIGASASQVTGILLALLAAVTQAVYTLCGRAVRRTLANTPYTLVVYSIACACLLLAALVLRIPADGMNWQGIGWSAALALVCTLGGHSMQNYALRYYKAPTVSTAILTEVFTGPLLVLLILGEVPRLTSVLGGLVIICGVAWYMIYERRASRGAV